jgi:hypothetical protein
MSLFSDKNVLPNDSNLENPLHLVSGIIKGVLSAFNFDCSVSFSFKPQPIINCILSHNIGLSQQQSIYSYSFHISLLNYTQS